MVSQDTKPLILIVDDNGDIILNLKITLENNNFRVISAESGREAIKKLTERKKLPDLIISDIMMPEISGYEFFEAISKTPRLNLIPFIFLTAKSTPEDIRFGKMLGVDDYLTKPFREEDLLAIIEGKLSRKQKGIEINEKLNILLSSLDLELAPSISEEEIPEVILLLVIWDDRIGPALKVEYPGIQKYPISMDEIASQLFQSAVSIYGQGSLTSAEGILLFVDNIKKSGYIFFDSIKDSDARARETQFMLGLLAPKINYIESMRIKEIFRKIAQLVKDDKEINYKEYWEKITEILSKPIY